MALRVKELHHQAVRVPPLRATDVQRFYEDVLGLQSDPNRPDFPVPGAWMNVGDGEGASQIHIVGADGPSAIALTPERDPSRPHVALAVEDLIEAKAELERMAVPFWEFEMGKGPEFSLLFLDDPAGNLIEIHQFDLCGCKRR